jgi:hypothetical protein
MEQQISAKIQSRHALLSNNVILYGSSLISIAGIGGSPMHMLDSLI